MTIQVTLFLAILPVLFSAAAPMREVDYLSGTKTDLQRHSGMQYEEKNVWSPTTVPTICK